MSHLGGGKLGKRLQGPNRSARDIAEERLYHLLYLRTMSFWCYQRWQRCSARCSFKAAIAMATRSASCRSSEWDSLRSLIRFRILSRASWNSLSSLACSGQLIARVEEEHIRHLLKTPRRKVAEGRRKGKHYSSPIVRLLPMIPSLFGTSQRA